MKKIILISVLLISMLFSSCGKIAPDGSGGGAPKELCEIVSEFELEDNGIIYTDVENAEYPLSDGLISSMFGCGEGTMRHVVSRAAYFSRRFSDGEIVVLEVSDRSRREEIYSMCLRRAAKKKSAIVYADGNFVYLICTDMNSKIAAYIRNH